MIEQDYATVSSAHFVMDVELDESIQDEATASASSERSETGGSEGAPSSEVSHNHSQERQKESKIAKTIAKTMRNLLAYDEVQGEWYRYKDNIWQEVTDKTARRIINKKLSESYKNGFSLSFLRNMEGFMQMFLYADNWQTDKKLLPMSNGVLNLDNKAIQPHSFRLCHR